jgi:hypothetical protein
VAQRPPEALKVPTLDKQVGGCIHHPEGPRRPYSATRMPSMVACAVAW